MGRFSGGRVGGAGPLEVLDLPVGQAADQAIKQLAKRPGVAFAEKNWRLQTQATSDAPAMTKHGGGHRVGWAIVGHGISTSDFVGLSSLQGSFAVDASGTATLQTTVAADLSSEGNESLVYDVFSDAGLTTRVTGTAVVINDTSQASGMTLWGTAGNDGITGSGGPDRLSGVSATGTTATALGAKQVDTLTGLAGADVFLLGDSRGVFYDDTVNNTLGSGDDALIKDFVAGVDKLQVRAGTAYIYTTSATGLSLYWDRNKDARLTSSGKSQDELVAVLQGVPALGGGGFGCGVSFGRGGGWGLALVPATAAPLW